MTVITLCGCASSWLSLLLLNALNARAIVAGALAQGAAVALCMMGIRIARPGQRIVPVVGLMFCAVISTLEAVAAVSFLYRVWSP